MAGLAVVLVVALALRLFGITWGLPDETHLFSYHPDEFHSLRGAFSLALGDANPHFFNYGSLYLYLVAATVAISNPALFSQVAVAVPGGPVLPEVLRTWTLDARVLTVILGVATVAVVYATARRIWGHREGLAAGLLLALAPLHVLHSHYATVDVPGALFTALACYFAVVMVGWLSWRSVLWAGVAAGLAASVKYSGGAALVAPVVAWGIVWWRDRERDRPPQWAKLVALPAAALAAFAMTSPYTFIDWQSAWRDISFEMEHMRVGDDPAMIALHPSGWLFHLGNVAQGTGFIMLAAAAVGLGAGLSARRRELLPPAVFGLVAFVMIGGAEVRYARYAVPLLPVVAVLAAGVVSMDPFTAVRGRWRSWATAGAVSVVMVGSVLAAGLMSHRMLGELVGPDARAEALALLEDRVPRDGAIGLVSEPWFYHPPVDYCNGGVALRGNPLWGAYHRPIRDLRVVGLDAARLADEAPGAMVLTGVEIGVRRAAGDTQAAEFDRALIELGYELTARFRAGPWEGRGGRPIAQDLTYPFPTIEVWLRGSE
ncbi:MAG: ArnT family glycosyltransferase [Armatimonadota bacterium]|jgi:4-amino-4-deoxy-L-arabinose transferase-like glycosyltransferase